ncbi:MAG: hypothetical protein HYT83_02915 [Candidatus Levybacteria bacterium]|nr:hypothetical protein [Candidatus Levybacteria bacterium]
MAKKKSKTRARIKTKTSAGLLSFLQENKLYDKKDWKKWIIIYSGIAMIFYGTLYVFMIAK